MPLDLRMKGKHNTLLYIIFKVYDILGVVYNMLTLSPLYMCVSSHLTFKLTFNLLRSLPLPTLERVYSLVFLCVTVAHLLSLLSLHNKLCLQFA